VSFEPPPLGESCITKVADREFAVQSESSIDVVFASTQNVVLALATQLQQAICVNT